MDPNDFIVCLPVLNEELAIKKMICDIQPLGYKVVVSDGGSTDQSIDIATKLNVPILFRNGKEKGFGMLQAMAYAQKNQLRYIVFIDCDLTYPVDKIVELTKVLIDDDLDMTVGRRNRENMSFKSILLNSSLNMLMKVLFGEGLKDPASGFRAMKINSFQGQLVETGMDLEIEISAFALIKKLKVKEISVDYLSRVGNSKLTFKHIFQALFTIFRVRFRNYR